MRQMEEIATVLETRNYSLNNIICDTMKEFKLKSQDNLTRGRKAPRERRAREIKGLNHEIHPFSRKSKNNDQFILLKFAIFIMLKMLPISCSKDIASLNLIIFRLVLLG